MIFVKGWKHIVLWCSKLGNFKLASILVTLQLWYSRPLIKCADCLCTLLILAMSFLVYGD